MVPGVALTLYSFVVNSTRRFILSLALRSVLVFFSPFSIAIISLGEERASLCGFRAFVCYARVVLCPFPLLLGLAATCNCGTLWTFLFTFLYTKAIDLYGANRLNVSCPVSFCLYIVIVSTFILRKKWENNNRSDNFQYINSPLEAI